MRFDRPHRRVHEAQQRIVADVARLPRMTGSAVNGAGLFYNDSICWPPGAGDDIGAGKGAATVSADYFDVLHLSIRRGRTFRSHERDGVVVVNEAFLGRSARRLCRSGCDDSSEDDGLARTARRADYRCRRRQL